MTTKAALNALIRALAAEYSLLRSPVVFTSCILGMIATPEVWVHEGLRSMAYPVEATAREIIVAAQRGVREAFVPHWTGFGTTLSFVSPYLESIFMSHMYTFKIPAYVDKLRSLQRSSQGAGPAADL